jgi:hypothetical protein
LVKIGLPASFFTFYYVILLYKNLTLRFTFTLYLTILLFNSTFSQIVVSGNVLDKSKLNYVEGVSVLSTSKKSSITDTMGRYAITVNKTDSIYFVYNGKPTQKFAVATIPNYDQFDISLHLNIKGKHSVLKEVIVYTKYYKLDSLENRNTYAKIFNYHKPRLESSYTPGGAAGFDANELFSLFTPKKNKRMQKLQDMMLRNEEELYVNYRFNKNFVRRVTQIKGAALDTFMVLYRPSYFFLSTSTEIQFNQYILNASYQFKRLRGEIAPPSNFSEEGELPKPNRKITSKNVGIIEPNKNKN